MKNELPLCFISLLVLVGVSITLGHVASPSIESVMSKIQNRYGNSPEECSNLSLRDTAYCLNDYVKSIYKYNKTEDSIRLNLTELMQRGGDCRNWAELYSEYASNLGFDVSTPVVLTGDRTAHTFTIISDRTGYCLLDQMTVKCFGLLNEDD